MSTYKSDLLRVLSERGFIHQVSEPEALDALAQSSRITGYIGFDCTAPSLHVGSLVQIMMLHWMQQTGHQPIALMGGGTTRVGDPSGKDESRRLLDEAMIARNLAGIRAVFDKFLKFGSGPGDAVMADNADWLNGLNYIDFLREVGRHFSVNRMLSFESIKLRLDRHQELSFLEFNYMILQAYDFIELYRRYGCVLQMGGSDQWGNIVNGIELGRRMCNVQLFALTSPLITTNSGAKMGKTAAGAVWLDPDVVSPYDYWQFWRNTEDADVGRFLKLFTVLPLDEIERLESLEGQDINEAKKVLATEATALVHGRAAGETAAATARTTFEEGGLATTLPTVDIPAAELAAGIPVPAAFVRSGLVSSTSEARRQIKGGGLRINDAVIEDDQAVLTNRQLTAEGVIKLSLGRKRHILLRPVQRNQVERVTAAKNSRDLEVLVAKIQAQLAPDAEVLHDTKLPGRHSKRERQIDVLVRQRIGQYTMLIVLDCKDYARPVDVKGVEEFHGLVSDVGAHKGVLFSPKGFTQAAKERASGLQIDLYSPVDTDPHKWQTRVTAPTLCDFRSASLSFGIMTSAPKPFVFLPHFWSKLVAYDREGNELGTPLSAAIQKWNQGQYPTEPGEHRDLNIFDTAEVMVDNGYGERIPATLTVSLFVQQQLFFGHLPIQRVSGFKDELSGAIITNAFTTGILDPEEVVKKWAQIRSEADVPLTPMMRLAGLIVWDDESENTTENTT
jgi:tyrosyl-tRNA synthetase